MPIIHDSPASPLGGASPRRATVGVAARTLRSWPEWSPCLAAAFSATYACLGLWWTLGRGAFPFGVGPALGPAAPMLHGVSAAAGAPVVAALGLGGAVAALLGARLTPGRRTVLRTALPAYSWAMAVVLLVVVPDARAIAVAAYAPVFLLGAPFGWPPGDFWSAVSWPIANQYLCIVGGFLWVATALVSSRRARGACVACGRGARDHGSVSRAAPRWGTWATVVAAVLPLPYAATRLAWALGVPLGTSAELLRLARGDAWFPAGALAAVAIGGAVLTLVLVRPWGERFPRWLPFVRGRRVPPALAVIPASLVSALVFAAGLGVLRAALRAGFDDEAWSAMGMVGLVWPLWGLALGAATLAYHRRRRGPCVRSGRS